VTIPKNFQLVTDPVGRRSASSHRSLGHFHDSLCMALGPSMTVGIMRSRIHWGNSFMGAHFHPKRDQSSALHGIDNEFDD
jgi:hypothetical protein